MAILQKKMSQNVEKIGKNFQKIILSCIYSQMGIT
jgi:hypothetical protein